MKPNNPSSRRRFFWKAGALLSAPLATATHCNAAGRSIDNDALARRLASLEDVNAIRELHEAYVQSTNRGDHAEAARLFVIPSKMEIDKTVRRVFADRFDDIDTVEIDPNSQTAIARVRCTVEIETMIGPGCTLVDMARGQGEGVLRRSESRVLEGSYVKHQGVWRIARMAWRPVSDSD
jgi:hypothetical protein